jgi:sugar phosphate permease
VQQRRALVLVFLPFVSGYYLSYIYRTINALISGQLMTELGLNAADLGLLTSAYFLTFALVQLPLGILLDRFGPRRVPVVDAPLQVSLRLWLQGGRRARRAWNVFCRDLVKSATLP